MTTRHDWSPALPAQSLAAADGVVAAQVHGQDLALWRSANGTVQAWEDRCPHRGVALSLGRVLGDRLACAYHGWEYAQDSGRCVAIPALPNQPVPGAVCVTTYHAVQHDGMVWVALGKGAAPLDEPSTTPRHLLRSVAVAAPLASVEAMLAAHDFTPAGHCQWNGRWRGHALHLWVLDAAPDWCMLHVAADTQAADPALAGLFGAVRRLRDLLQAPVA